MKFPVVVVLSVGLFFGLLAAPSQAASLKEELNDKSLAQRLLGTELENVKITLGWKSAKFSEIKGFEVAELSAVSLDLVDESDAHLKVAIPAMKVTKKTNETQYRIDLNSQVTVTIDEKNKIDPSKNQSMAFKLGFKNASVLYDLPEVGEKSSSFTADSFQITYLKQLDLTMNQLSFATRIYPSIAADPAALKSTVSLSFGSVNVITDSDSFAIIPPDGKLKLLFKIFGDFSKFYSQTIPKIADTSDERIKKIMIEWSNNGGKFQLEEFELTGFGAPIRLDMMVSNFGEVMQNINPFPNFDFTMVYDNLQLFLAKAQTMRSKNGVVYMQPQIAATIEAFLRKYAEFDGDKVTLKITSDGRSVTAGNGETIQ